MTEDDERRERQARHAARREVVVTKLRELRLERAHPVTCISLLVSALCSCDNAVAEFVDLVDLALYEREAEDWSGQP